MVRALVLSVVLSVGLIAGCGSADVALDPAWGRQPCAHCGMLLDDAQSAAQLVRSDGARLPTPMDFGYVAHASGTGATFDGVRAQVVTRLAISEGDHGIP
jgi:hypothetical protein